MATIHELIKLNIGNINQSVSIHGNDVSKPILLLLHGGPGMAQIGFIRYFTQPLENEFIIVNWDQRGAGKSYSSDIETSTMTIGQFVADTIELTDYLLSRFQQSKLFLCGHSWGTVVGLLAAYQRPELFRAYIGVSQVVNMVEGETISYQFTLDQAKQTNNQKAVNELIQIGQPPFKSLKDNLLQRKWLNLFGGSTHSANINKLMQKASSTKEYTIWDWLWRFRKGMTYSLTHLKDELMDVAFDKTILKLDLPVYFFEGDTDFQVPSILAKNYFETIEATTKKRIVFENCGHMIPFEQPEKFCAELMAIQQVSA
jgi:pimeloyl-ACP methyl ester carboxylesterase